MVKALLALLLMMVPVTSVGSYVILPTSEAAMTAILDYSTSTGFTYTSSDIEFAAGVAKLKSQIPADVMAHATYASTTDLTFGRGVKTGTITGTVTIANGGLDLSAVSNNKIRYPALGNFTNTHVGCVRFRYKPTYSGTPSVSQTMIVRRNSSGSSQNVVELRHLTTSGNIQISILAPDNSTFSAGTYASWAPTAGTWYEIELNYDSTIGTYNLYVDGVRRYNTNVGTTGAVGYSAEYFEIGFTNQSQFVMKDLMIFSAVQNTAGTRTTGYTNPPALDYLTTDPTITQTTGITTSLLSTFATGVASSGSDAVKFQLDVDGTKKYWNGSAWATSDGTYAQSSTTAQINDNLATLLSAESTVKVIAVLHSATGATTPTVSFVRLTYQ